jgi:hypothetical protein
MWNLWAESVKQIQMAHGSHLKVSGVSVQVSAAESGNS